MSEDHVTQVFGPPWVREARAHDREQLDWAMRIIPRLRALLREHDPTLPHPLDGTAWAKIEAP